MSSRSWYNSGSDIKWSWEGALGFRSPCPQPPSLDADRQVMRSSLERETLLPLEGSPRPQCSTGWGSRGKPRLSAGVGVLCIRMASTRSWRWVDGPL